MKGGRRTKTMAAINGLLGIHWHELNVGTPRRFETFKFISSFNSRDLIKRNEKRVEQLHSRKFCWKLIASNLDPGSHSPVRIWWTPRLPLPPGALTSKVHT
jgi:hypothetical protein